jgi:hypothetical protein
VSNSDDEIDEPLDSDEEREKKSATLPRNFARYRFATKSTSTDRTEARKSLGAIEMTRILPVTDVAGQQSAAAVGGEVKAVEYG